LGKVKIYISPHTSGTQLAMKRKWMTYFPSIEYHPLLNTETMFLGEENIQPTIDTSKISIQIEPYS
jgi:hypothetical protein